MKKLILLIIWLFAISLSFGQTDFFLQTVKKISQAPSDYQAGDIVCWDLNGRGLTHIGIVSRTKSEDEKRNLIIHNVGAERGTTEVRLRYD